jgi:hypothetical protein
MIAFEIQFIQKWKDALFGQLTFVLEVIIAYFEETNEKKL